MSRYTDAFKRMQVSLDEICKKYHKKKTWFYFDAMKASIRYGVTPNEYINFAFYKKNKLERKQYYTRRSAKKYENKLNEKSVTKYFNDKVLFNETFKEHVHRDFLATENATIEEIQTFLAEHNKVIVKPTSLSSGRGIYVWNGEKDIQVLKEENFLLEEFIQQHNEMSRLNASSVNTVRVYTILDQNQNPHILSVTLRVGGNGSEVDNFHAGGVAYPVDIDSGIVISAGTNIHGKEHIFHPNTNQQMLGFSIPNYKELIEFIHSASKVVPQARFVAWDVAVLENGFEMVEGNCQAGLMLLQNIEGKLKVIKSYI